MSVIYIVSQFTHTHTHTHNWSESRTSGKSVKSETTSSQFSLVGGNQFSMSAMAITPAADIDEQ